MAIRLPETLTRGQLLTVLTVLATAAVLTITLLLVVTKATIVEIEVRVDEVSLTVVPPSRSSVELFDSRLEVQDLQWEGADRFEATLAAPRAGRAVAEPEGASVIGLGAAATFQPVVHLRRPMRLKLEPESSGSLTITLHPVTGIAVRKLGFEAELKVGDWLCQVPPREDLELRLRNVELTVNAERFPDPETKLEPAAVRILFFGGTQVAELGLQPVFEPQGLTAVSVLDSQAGEVVEKGRLPLKLPQDRMLVPMGDRLILFDREPRDPEAGKLLAPSLTVVAPSFYRRQGELREQSFLLGGRIRFPGGEKKPVELERGLLLRVPERTELRLESLRMKNGNLELALWGKPSSLELGPTLELMDELLPSVFVWLSTHQLPLVFSVLGTLLTGAVILLRLLGLVKGVEEGPESA